MWSAQQVFRNFVWFLAISQLMQSGNVNAATVIIQSQESGNPFLISYTDNQGSHLSRTTQRLIGPYGTCGNSTKLNSVPNPDAFTTVIGSSNAVFDRDPFDFRVTATSNGAKDPFGKCVVAEEQDAWDAAVNAHPITAGEFFKATLSLIGLWCIPIGVCCCVVFLACCYLSTCCSILNSLQHPGYNRVP